MDTLKAEKRDMSTKAKKLRREGYVTGNVFGHAIKGSIPVKIEKKDAERLFKTKKKGSQIMLDVDGEQMGVLVKEIDYNPVKGQLEEIDFQALVSGEAVHSVAEVVLKNEAKVVGGVVELILEEISYKAVPSEMIETVEIDVGDMKPGDVLKVADLPIAANKNIHLKTDPEAVVVSVVAPKSADVPDDEEAEGDEKDAKASK
ncbi:50S ribosomal protein L25 [Brotaphodocola sp.]|uniref:50S ribosomal protein L25 n=1 Tax=Brotaphodocola sp. TaxID=3073577 RepID=UPI003D7C682C